MKIMTIPNDDYTVLTVKALRKFAKGLGGRIRIYGRCRDKKTAFSQTGRRHSENSNSNSIYSLKSPESKHCYAWAIYFESNS